MAPGNQLGPLSASLLSLRLCVESEGYKKRPASSRPGLLRCVGIGMLLLALGGCQSPRQFWDSLKGEGFPEWSGQMAGGMRGTPSDAKPSGFFTDRRSEQIEQNLGGGF
jgi:hypothetical protein